VTPLRAALALSTSILVACGGQVIFEPGGDGGSGPASSSVATSTSSGTVRCGEHSDCGPAELCIFGTGECATACEAGVPCAFGEVCDECGTSSCPGCRDCRAVCVVGDDPPPKPQPVCTSHQDCADGGVESLCLFDLGLCTRPCGPAQPPCPPSESCEDCATSSCQACDDCVRACRPLDR